MQWEHIREQETGRTCVNVSSEVVEFCERLQKNEKEDFKNVF